MENPQWTFRFRVVGNRLVPNFVRSVQHEASAVPRLEPRKERRRFGCLRRVVTTRLACALLAGGCQAGSTGGAFEVDGGDDGGSAEASIDAAIFEPPPPCTETPECPDGHACHPYGMVCVKPGEGCGGAAAETCGDAFYCEESLSVCLPGLTGSPCDSDESCVNLCTDDNVCGCDGVAHERELERGPLDIFLVLDRTASMGAGCTYTPGTSPPVPLKGCLATYALADYLTNVEPAGPTRLAINFLPINLQPVDYVCNGDGYETPAVDFTSLPATLESPLVNAITSVEFEGRTSTESALRGIVKFTAANQTEDREMIGVLITDGEPTECETDTEVLKGIIQDHFENTGIRTFVIGMLGATESVLETIASGGGTTLHDESCGSVDPPCFHWNIGLGQGSALGDALQAITASAQPFDCSLSLGELAAPEGEMFDFNRINVSVQDEGPAELIAQVPDVESCPSDAPAWYYDDPEEPTAVLLCPVTCDDLNASDGDPKVRVIVGCKDTVVLI